MEMEVRMRLILIRSKYELTYLLPKAILIDASIHLFIEVINVLRVKYIWAASTEIIMNIDRVFGE